MYKDTTTRLLLCAPDILTAVQSRTLSPLIDNNSDLKPRLTATIVPTPKSFRWESYFAQDSIDRPLRRVSRRKHTSIFPFNSSRSISTRLSILVKEVTLMLVKVIVFPIMRGLR